MGSFQRVNPLAAGAFIRAPARLLVEPITAPYPAKLADIVKVDTAGQASEVQTLTITGTPTGGSFILTFNGYPTGALAYNATAADVAAALQLLGNIGSNGVTTSGGPFPGSPVVVTFTGPLANQAQSLITHTDSFTGGTTPTLTVVRTTPGIGQWDTVGAWTELGATKTGVSVERNNTEESFDVDQIVGQLFSQPTDWTVTVSTALAEATFEHLQLCWECGTITTDVTNNERHLPIGAPLTYAQRRLAIIAQRPVDSKVRAAVLRQVQRQPVASTAVFNKTGEQQTIPIQFRALPDPTLQDTYGRFGEWIEQIV